MGRISVRVNGIPVEEYLMREGKGPLKRGWRRGRHNQERALIRAAKRVWAWARMWWMAVLYR